MAEPGRVELRGWLADAGKVQQQSGVFSACPLLFPRMSGHVPSQVLHVLASHLWPASRICHTLHRGLLPRQDELPGPAVQGTQQQLAPGRVDEGAQVLLQGGLAWQRVGKRWLVKGSRICRSGKGHFGVKDCFELKALRKQRVHEGHSDLPDFSWKVGYISMSKLFFLQPGGKEHSYLQSRGKASGEKPMRTDRVTFSQ